MSTINFIIFIFWTTALIRRLFFWVYLWQLKEYHRKRFIDHFRTEKGKKIFQNRTFIIKISLLFLSFISNFFVYILFLIYILEALKTLLGIFRKTILKPIPTLKSSMILAASFALAIAVAILFFNTSSFIRVLLTIDLFIFTFVSIFVFFFSPLTTFFQYRLLKKAKRKRERHKNLIVVGITGSYGKTSTKEFLAQILLEKFKVLKTPKNNNSEVGIAQTILNDLKDQEIFIAEIGAYDKGKVKQVCKFLQPQIGIVCGINEQHLSLFGSMENLISSEGGKELVESLPENGMAIFNEDSYIIKNSKLKIQNYNPKLKNIKFCSVKEKKDIWAQDIRVEKEFLLFKISSRKDEAVEFRVNLLGSQNIENILLAVCCAKELKMSLKEIAPACQKIKPQDGTLRLIKNKNNLNIIDSTYSTNPSAVIAHLEYLKLWKGKKVIVMPCIIELGKYSSKIHQKIGKEIAKVCDLAIITAYEKFEDIKKGAQSQGMDEKNILYLENPIMISKKLKEFFKDEDIILLEGRPPGGLAKLLL